MRLSFVLMPLLFAGSALAQEPKVDPDDPPPPDKLEKFTLTIDPGRHTATIRRAYFNPDDGNQLITLADDGAIRLWDVAQARTTKVIYLPGMTNVGPATMSKDGKRLAVPARYLEYDKEVHVIYVLTLPDGRLEKTLRYHPPQVSTLAFAPDGKRLAWGSAFMDGVWLSDLTRDDPPKVIRKGRGKVVSGLAFPPDGQHLACVRGQTGTILDLNSGQELDLDLKSKQKYLGEGQCHVAWSPDGKTIATATTHYCEIRLHDAQGKLLHSANYQGYGSDLSFSPDSKTLLVVGRTGANQHRAAIFDVASGKERLVFPSKSGVHASFGGAFSPDGKFAATVGGGGEVNVIFVWGTNDGTVHKHIASEPWMFGGPNSVKPAWSKDGRTVCWCSSGGLGNKNSFRGRATFHLGELKFMPTLTAEQRYDPILDKEDLTEKDGLTLKWERPYLRVFKDNKLLHRHRIEAVEGIAHLGKGLVAVRRPNAHVTVLNVLTGQWGRLSLDGRFLMRANTVTQLLTIVGVDQAKPLLTLYRNGEDWIIWTEEGYYAATPGGERLIGWKIDNGINRMPSFYPAERFRKQFHRPDVIKLVLEKGSVAEALKVANAAAKIETRNVKVENLLPPRVELTVDDSMKPTYKLKVRAEASTKDQPIKSLRLKINNKVVLGNKAFAEFPGGTLKAEAEWTIELPEGEHQLNVMAQSAESTGFSPSKQVKFRPLAKMPTLHVLAVGINDYRDNSLDLKFAVPDAQALPNAFVKHCKGVNFLDVVPHPIVNKDATRKNILKKLADIRKEAKPQDLVIVFFACHGVKDKNGYYLLTHETNMKDLAGSTLKGSELRKELAQIKSQVLLMMDACHSNGIGLKPATDDATRDLTDDDVGVAVMCAAMSHEKAEGVDGHGRFTKAVLEALAGGPKVPAHPFNHRLYVHHLQSYVFDHVSHYSEDRQHPFLSLPWIVESFPVR